MIQTKCGAKALPNITSMSYVFLSLPTDRTEDVFLNSWKITVCNFTFNRCDIQILSIVTPFSPIPRRSCYEYAVSSAKLLSTQASALSHPSENSAIPSSVPTTDSLERSARLHNLTHEELFALRSSFSVIKYNPDDVAAVSPIPFHPPSLTSSSSSDPQTPFYSFLPDSLPADIILSSSTPTSSNTISYADALLASFMSLQHLSLPLDRLPRAFVLDIINRNLGDLFLVVLDLSSNHSEDMKERNTRVAYAPVVVGAVLIVHMVNWSRVKDAEFSLRKIANIFSIFTSHAFRGLGLASLVLDHAINACSSVKQSEEISLEVRASNRLARRLYERKGLAEQNEEDDYYEYGTDDFDRKAVEMACTITDYRPSSQEKK